MKDNPVSIDSNLWIYALTKPKTDKPEEIIKREISIKLFEELIRNNAKNNYNNTSN